jgi:hypothetical protein
VGQLKVIVRKPYGPESHENQQNDPNVKVGQICPEDYGENDRGEDQCSPHRGCSFLSQVRARPVVPNVLLDLKLLKLSNDPWTAEKRDHQRGEDSQNRPKSNVPEDVKEGKFGMQGIE